jgi:hypothetical protein
MRGITPALIASIVATAQANAQGSPRQPGLEEARLAYFTGRWVNEGQGGRGEFTERLTCEWFTGGFHVTCQVDVTSAVGVTTGQIVMGYDWLEKTYTYFEINSRGKGVFVRGNVSANVWTWEAPEVTLEGRRTKQRMVVTEESPSTYLIRFDSSVDGGPWVVKTESKATKLP